MKVLKLTTITLLITLCISARKPLTNTDFYYKSGFPYQRIAYDHCSESDDKEKSPDCLGGLDVFTDTGSWTTNTVSYTISTDMTKYIGKIRFNLDDTNPADGGSDGDLTLSEAIDIVYDHFAITHEMPTSVTAGTTVITIEAATAAH